MSFQIKMEMTMLSMLYSREAIEKAKKRGRAYMCLVCHRQTGEKRISEIGPMEDHILKTHVSRDRIPYYCRLCTFKCQTAHQINHHFSHYSRHVTAARQMGITNHQEWIEASTIPYKIGETDMLKFSQEESMLFYLKKRSGESSPALSSAAQTSTTVPAQPTGQLSFNSPQPQYLSATPIVAGQHTVPTFVPENQDTRMDQPTRCPTAVAGQHTVPTFVPENQDTRMDQPTRCPTAVAGQHTVPTFVPENQDTRMDQPTRCPTAVEGPLKSSTAVVNSTMAGFQQFTPLSTPNLVPVTSQWMEEPTPAYWTPLPATIHEPSTLTLSGMMGTSVAITQSHQSPIFTGSSLQSFRPIRASQESWASSVLNTPPAPTVQPSPAASLECAFAAPAQLVLGAATIVSEENLHHSNSSHQRPQGLSNTQGVESGNQSRSQSTATTRVQAEDNSLTAAGSRPEETVPNPSSRLADTVSQQGATSQAADTEGAEEVVEDLLPQLMPGEAELKPVDGPHTNASKRKVQAVALTIGKRRKRSATVTLADETKEGQIEHDQTKTDQGIDWESIGRKVQDKGEPTVEVSLVAMNGLVAALQSGSNQLARNEKSGERTEKALTEIAGILGKVADSLNRLKNAVEENTKEQRRREERYTEIERKREEEHIKDREAERRREDRRRDAEKREREEIKRLLIELKSNEKRNKDEKEEKENNKLSRKSVLTRVYTENTIRDLSKKK